MFKIISNKASLIIIVC